MRGLRLHRWSSSTKTRFWDRKQAIDICLWSFLPQELLHIQNVSQKAPREAAGLPDATRVSVSLKALYGGHVTEHSTAFYSIIRGQHFSLFGPNYQQRDLRLFSSRIPTSLVLLHTTYTCAFKPGCLMSHNWLHTPDCKVLNEKMK